MTADVSIDRLSRPQQPAAVEVLAAAFAADPVYRRLVPDPQRRAGALAALFRLAVGDAGRAGAVEGAAAGGRLVAVALWLAPGRFPLGAGRKLRSVPGMWALLRAAPRSLPALARLGAGIEAVHPPEPSWYLQAIGVHPAAQARGIGGRLLTHGLARADREQAAATLETAVPAAATLYERHGFHTVRSDRHLGDRGPVHQLMRRPPGHAPRTGQVSRTRRSG